MSDGCASKFHQISDLYWERIEPLFPVYKKSCNGGRPRLCWQKVMTGILYVTNPRRNWRARRVELRFRRPWLASI